MRYLKNRSGASYVFISSAAALAAAIIIGALTIGGDPSFGDIKRPKVKAKVEGNKFMGAGSCASSNCHGSAEPRNREGIDINQNEFSIWFARDKHRNSFNVLLNAESKQIGRDLGLAETPDKSAKCLVCHTSYVPVALWGNEFDFSDGVSCETCHGAAEKWLGPHTQKDFTEARARELGMIDTENIFSRAEQCMSCHIGDADKSVDHELIAAGHPDLNRFELDTFLALMPPHWRKDDDNEWEGAEVWTIGQTSALKQSMDQLTRRAANGSPNPWPEFSEFNCYACHHDLEDDSWRQKAGYPGRTPGFPAWNAARYILVQPVAERVSPAISGELSREVATLMKLLDRVGYGSSSQVASTAGSISNTVSDLQASLETLNVDEGYTYDMLLRISGDGNRIASAGIRSAQQAAVALETLFYTYSRNVQGPNNAQISAAISDLFTYLESPSSFTPGGFIKRMNDINSLIKSNR